MTTAAVAAPTAPRRPVLDRAVAMRLAAEEYARFAAALRDLDPDDWLRPTANEGWTVRDMAGHTLGMARMAASLREQRSQNREATRRGGVWIDALTGLQVERTSTLGTDGLVAELERTGRKAARARRRAPGFIRRRTLPLALEVQPDRPAEQWTLGFLLDVILTRDPWMHRADLSVATGRAMRLTPDHDGVLVADVVQEWAGRHGQPCTLVLSGPAGGTWTFGASGPRLELDAVVFCRILSGRFDGADIDRDSLLATRVPF